MNLSCSERIILRIFRLVLPFEFGQIHLYCHLKLFHPSQVRGIENAFSSLLNLVITIHALSNISKSCQREIDVEEDG